MKSYKIDNQLMYNIDEVRNCLRRKGGSKEVQKFDCYFKGKSGLLQDKTFFILSTEYENYKKKCNG